MVQTYLAVAMRILPSVWKEETMNYPAGVSERDFDDTEPPCKVCHHAYSDHVEENTEEDRFGNETLVTAQCLECDEADNCWGYKPEEEE